MIAVTVDCNCYLLFPHLFVLENVHTKKIDKKATTQLTNFFIKCFGLTWKIRVNRVEMVVNYIHIKVRLPRISTINEKNPTVRIKHKMPLIYKNHYLLLVHTDNFSYVRVIDRGSWLRLTQNSSMCGYWIS